jgi:hypothetical protein
MESKNDNMWQDLPALRSSACPVEEFRNRYWNTVPLKETESTNNRLSSEQPLLKRIFEYIFRLLIVFKTGNLKAKHFTLLYNLLPYNWVGLIVSPVFVKSITSSKLLFSENNCALNNTLSLPRFLILNSTKGEPSTSINFPLESKRSEHR